MLSPFTQCVPLSRELRLDLRTVGIIKSMFEAPLRLEAPVFDIGEVHGQPVAPCGPSPRSSGQRTTSQLPRVYVVGYANTVVVPSMST